MTQYGKFRASQAWADMLCEPVARSTGNNAPVFEQWFDDAGIGDTGSTRGVYLYSFDDAIAANEKEIFFNIQMSHEWNLSEIHIHVHWIPNIADTSATPRWGLEFNWKSPCQTFGANAAIIYATGNECGDTDLIAGKHYITEFAIQTPDATQNGVSSILICRLFRNSSDAADTYNVANNKCGLLYIDAHYVRNSTGSITEYTK